MDEQQLWRNEVVVVRVLKMCEVREAGGMVDGMWERSGLGG